VRWGGGPHLLGMHPPIFVRAPSDAERAQLEASLRAPSAFTVRRAQIVLLSAAGRRPSEIARGLCCAGQTVRDGIRALNATGLAALSTGSPRPRSAAPVLDGAKRERLRVIVHQSPRAFGQPRSTWTLALLARVAHAQGLSPTVLSPETIRQALLRLGVNWRRAKHWLTSPDPAYARKKTRTAKLAGW
jgi:transposase